MVLDQRIFVLGAGPAQLPDGRPSTGRQLLTEFFSLRHSMANLDSLTGHGLANRKRVARLNYGTLDGHKQRKVRNFRKTGVFLGLFEDPETLRLPGTFPSHARRFSLRLLEGRATHRRDGCLPCQRHERVWRFRRGILREPAH